jgi:hypothetical protein
MPLSVRGSGDERFVLQPTLRWCCLIDVTRLSRHHRAWLAAALGSPTLTGCGVAGPESRTFVGPVTVVGSDSVCIGGPNASGECFAKDQMTRNLNVSDCVRVTYTPPNQSAACATPTKIENLDASSHTADCPRQ